MTADALLKELDENALSAADKYKGKMVQVTGTLTNIDSSGDYFSLGPTKGDSVTLTGVQVFLDEGQRSTVAGFKKGQKITVVGEMRGVGEVIGYTMNAASMKVTT
ncbi:OB-fold protein [Mobilicoccus caccae]|uniref:Uncharacterized protein n=1 Tax=Mobilicoccus caccae TaxID=1859295 RepID=A0ABQ6IU02_9MICO|nr:hypothetical protein [Mobilicoccus caccae]GMA41423.1 hypothetical protein GCM10025883_34680 [Mobilicoccus caccae]